MCVLGWPVCVYWVGLCVCTGLACVCLYWGALCVCTGVACVCVPAWPVCMYWAGLCVCVCVCVCTGVACGFYDTFIHGVRAQSKTYTFVYEFCLA